MFPIEILLQSQRCHNAIIVQLQHSHSGDENLSMVTMHEIARYHSTFLNQFMQHAVSKASYSTPLWTESIYTYRLHARNKKFKTTIPVVNECVWRYCTAIKRSRGCYTVGTERVKQRKDKSKIRLTRDPRTDAFESAQYNKRFIMILICTIRI